MAYVETVTPSSATLEQQLRLEEVVAACTNIVTGLEGGSDLDDLLRRLAREVSGLLGIGRCSVYLRSEGGSSFQGRVAHGAVGDDGGIRRLVAGVDADAFTQEILATLAPVLIEDAMHDPRPVRASVRAFGIRSLLGVPMIDGNDEVIGLLFLDSHDKPLRMDDVDMETAGRVGRLCGAVVASALKLEEGRAAEAAESRGKQVLGRVLALQRSLGHDLVSGGELEALAERVAIFVKKPVCLYGPGGELQAFAQLPEIATVLPFRPPAVLPNRALDVEGERAAALAGPFPEAGVVHRLVIAHVRDHQGETAGLVVIAEHHGRLTGLDKLAAQTFAELLMLRNHAAREGAQAREGRRADLARDLIFGYGEETKLAAQARDHGIRLGDGAHLVATIAQRDQLGGTVDLRPEPVQRALTRVFRTDQVFVGRADGSVFVLLAGIGEDDKATTDLVRAVLDGVVEELWQPDADVIAALARPCFKVRDFPRARRECERGLEVLRSVGGGAPRRTVSAQELGVLSLAGGGSGRAGAGQFAVDVLGELATPESGELLQTLAAYFDADRSARGAAEILGVHQNTVRYRLGSIAKHTQLDVLGSPGDEQLARLAVGILRMQGRMPEPSAASGQRL